MAEDVLRPYPTARGRRQDRAFADLLDWLDGHPLSLRLLLPQLETVPAARLLDGLKGNTANLPPGFVGEGRLASLGASLKYSFDHLAAEMRERLPALALFEGVVDEDVLALLSVVKTVAARFAGVTKEAWSTTLRRLAGSRVREPGLGPDTIAMYAIFQNATPENHVAFQNGEKLLCHSDCSDVANFDPLLAKGSISQLWDRLGQP